MTQRTAASAADTIKLKLLIAYDGTAYQGWQVQKTGVGVQQKIEEAMVKLFPSVKRLLSSSRTDTGVHALGMVADVEIPRAELKMTLRKVPLAIICPKTSASSLLNASGLISIRDSRRRGNSIAILSGITRS